MKLSFRDGLASLKNSFINSRNETVRNSFSAPHLSFYAMRELYKLGLPNKICRIKASAATRKAFDIEDLESEQYFNDELLHLVKQKVLN